jgi:ComF family protein
MFSLRNAISNLRDAAAIFLPVKCLCCGESGGMIVCEECERKTITVSPPYCGLCGRPLPPGVRFADDCSECRSGTPLDSCRSPFVYAPPVDELVKQFKFNGNYAAGDYLLKAALERAQTDRELFALFPECDAIVPVPLHPIRRIRRGFNQSEHIARGFSRLWGIPISKTLARRRNTPPQSKLSKQERMRNVSGAFALRKSSDARGKKVILVDDVMTTGSTMKECARILKEGGAAEVHGLTLARRV